ncbi:MAG: YitT family protein [Lachnospiraceae bacterium]|nr:YitT family protein [Lachnospiraceae bacterium]
MKDIEQKSKNKLMLRMTFLIIGLFISGVGVAITKRGMLGVSPVSSVANIISIKFPVLSFGTWLFLWNCILILGQIVILRKDFKLFQLLQIPLSVLFGWFTDIGVWIGDFIPNELYIVRLGLVLLGTAILGFGIAMTVNANLVMNSGEAFVKAIADKWKKVFGNVKIVFDVSCVTLSIILSLIFFDFSVVGTREGTIIAAFLTGMMVKMFQKIVNIKI